MLTQGQKIDFLEKIFGKSEPSSKDYSNIAFVCPICKHKYGHSYSKKKLIVKIDETRLKSHCWVCEEPITRNIYKLVSISKPELLNDFIELFSIQNVNLSEEINEGFKSPLIQLPNNFDLLANHLDTEDSYYLNPINYLKTERKIINSEFWKWKFGLSESEFYKNRIIIPSFDAQGKVNYFLTRAYDKYTRPKYFNPKADMTKFIFNELFIDWNKPLYLFEGFFKACKFDINFGILLGSSLGHDYMLLSKILENKTKIILCMDNDAKEKRMKILKMLYAYDIKVAFVDLPDSINSIDDVDIIEGERMLRNNLIHFNSSNKLKLILESKGNN